MLKEIMQKIQNIRGIHAEYRAQLKELNSALMSGRITLGQYHGEFLVLKAKLEAIQGKEVV